MLARSPSCTQRNGNLAERVNRLGEEVERIASLCVAANALLGAYAPDCVEKVGSRNSVQT
jgi:hypothetical protein